MTIRAERPEQSPAGRAYLINTRWLASGLCCKKVSHAAALGPWPPTPATAAPSLGSPCRGPLVSVPRASFLLLCPRGLCKCVVT